MSNKKSEEVEQSAELQELEQRVDAMMSTETEAKPAKADAIPAKKTSSLKIISDYPGNPKTAPELSPKLTKTVKPTKVAKPKPQEQPTIAELAAGAPVVATEAPAEPAEPPTSLLEDTETDKAVEDIVIHEGDTQLAVDDAIAKRKAAESDGSSGPGIITRFFTSPWTWLFIIGTAAVAYAWFH